MRRLAFALTLTAALTGFARADEAQPVFPDLVSTPASEVKLTMSPDGTRILFGTIGWGGGGTGWDIYETVKTEGRWSAPQLVHFNSEANDFDPFFAPDGSGVYFFSNRLGGEGGDDLYFSALDPVEGYTYAENLGPDINTAGDEWAPVVSFDGTQLLFSSSGRGGQGRHDLFIAMRDNGSWTNPQSLGVPVNTSKEDFDAAFVTDDDTIVFASGDLEPNANAQLYVTMRVGEHWSKPRKLGPAVNCSASKPGLSIGPSTATADPTAFYFTSNCRPGAPGRMDIFRITIDEALAEQ